MSSSSSQSTIDTTNRSINEFQQQLAAFRAPLQRAEAPIAAISVEAPINKLAGFKRPASVLDEVQRQDDNIPRISFNDMRTKLITTITQSVNDVLKDTISGSVNDVLKGTCYIVSQYQSHIIAEKDKKIQEFEKRLQEKDEEIRKAQELNRMLKAKLLEDIAKLIPE